jgi:hypothetical protein
MVDKFTAEVKKLKAAFFYIGIPILVFMAISSNAQINKNAASTHQVITKQLAQDKKRDTNVKKLIADNAKQTQILCTVIISDGATLSPSERTKIEAICQQQIKEAASAEADNASQTDNSAPSNPVIVSPSSNTTPDSTPAQPDNVQPAPSLGDRVRGIVKLITPL